MKKGTKVVKLLSVMGTETATLGEVESVKKGVVRLVDSSLTYALKDGREVDPAIPGCHSRIVIMEGDD